jgi:2-hydroxychromene-2-carboxylate isomerase
VNRRVRITLWTDPACPFAFSAEPVRMRLRWQYGDGLDWTPRMIVLTREDGEAEKLATGGAGLQARHGMPIAPRPYPRPATSEPACLAVVAARERSSSPALAERLLRAQRVRVMDGGLLDDPELLDGAARDAGLEPAQLRDWMEDQAVRTALEADVFAARQPSDGALALDHKLGGPPAERRYTAPSYELERDDGSLRLSVPGFNPAEVYEIAIANLAPELARREPPESVGVLLEWAQMPLATAEVVEIMRRPEPELRDELRRCAVASPAGADMYWRLPHAG